MPPKRSPLYEEFKEWFFANRDAIDIPSYVELARRYGVGVWAVKKWVYRLGGFKHKGKDRSVLLKVAEAREYLKNCTRPIGIKALMMAVGYEEASTNASKRRFLATLKKRYPECFRKIKRYGRDPNSDEELLKWGKAFYRINGRPPMNAEISKHLGRDATYARKRIEALLEVYPDAPFIIGYEINEFIADAAWRRECKKGGRRTRLKEWNEWKSETFPEGLGFDFDREYWKRYLVLWDLRRRGYELTADGRARKIGTHTFIPLEEALKEEAIR